MTGLKLARQRLADAGLTALARAMRALPGPRRALRLPHRRIHRLAPWIAAERAAARATPAEAVPLYRLLSRSLAVRRPAPSNALRGAIPPPLADAGFHVHQDVFLARLPRARVLGPNGTVLTATGDVVEESTWGGPWLGGDRAFRALRLPPPTPLDGEHYTIASTSAEGYAHWLLDVLPRLIAFGHVAAARPSVVVARPLTAWQGESLHAVGFAHVPLVVLGDRYVAADVLHFPSYVGRPGQAHPWACQWLRDRVLGPARPGRPHRRLYVTRRLARRRRVVNEEELMPILSDHGFETVECENLTFREQVDRFRDAEIVVAPHGAGLTNLLWVPSGCRVLELFGRRCVRSLFYALAAGRSAPYWFLVGDSVGSLGVHRDVGFYDMRVPPADFARAVRAVLKPAAAPPLPAGA